MAHLWQVADFSQANGVFKMERTQVYQEIYDALSGAATSKTDIIPTAKKAWVQRFGNALNVLKAIHQQGWNPLNCAFLADPELGWLFQAKEMSTANNNNSTDTLNGVGVNLSGKTTSSCFDKII